MRLNRLKKWLRVVVLINLIILSSHFQAIAQTDEILERAKEFVQNQEKILPQYTASVSATLLVEESVIKGEGILCFKPPGRVDLLWDVDKKYKKIVDISWKM